MFLLNFLTFLNTKTIHIETSNNILIPLKKMNLEIEVFEGTSKSIFTLIYQNDNEESIEEAKLILPFDTNNAISDVILSYNDKIFISKSMEKNQAQETFNENKNLNHTSLLISRFNDFLSIQLAIIPKKTIITIQFTLYNNLEIKFNPQKELFFSKYGFPITFIPRYSPSFNENSIQPNLISQNLIPYSFSINFKSPTAYLIETNLNININNNSFIYNELIEKDLIIDIYYLSTPKHLIEEYYNSQCIKFNINGLTIGSQEINNDIISISFIVDQSGSMYGDSILNVKKALDIFLHSLPNNCKFDIISFGSLYHSLFNELKEYNDETLLQSLNYVSNIKANMGGTEILQPLKFVLQEQKPNICILLTDGAVSNNDQILSFISEFNTKIFTLGIGSYASIDLVRGLAEKTGGIYEFISNTNDIESSVIRTLNDAINPSLTNIEIESNCGKLMQKNVSYLPRNSLTQISFLNENKKECFLKIKGKDSKNQILEFYFESKDSFSLGNSKHLHCSTLIKASNQDILSIPDIINNSIKLNLLTKYTSLILFDNSTSHENLNKINLEIPIPSRYNDNNPIIQMMAAPPNIKYQKMSRSFKTSIENNQVVMDESSKEINNNNNNDLCKKIVNLQTAKGFWSNIILINEILNLKIENINNEKLTALAIIYLEKNCDSKFNLIINKAKNWLKTQNSNDLLEWAKQFI